MKTAATLRRDVIAMSPRAVAAVRRLEDAALELPQVAVETTHTFHAGVYARTVRIPAGVMVTGALIQIPTVLIVAGECVMYGEDGPVELSGYNVFRGTVARKSALVAKSETCTTMIFATEARTIEEAEAEFTEEAERLASRGTAARLASRGEA